MTGKPQWMSTNCFGKLGREEEEVELHFMWNNFEYMEVNYGDHKISFECLWIKIRGIFTKSDLVLTTCYQPPSQNNKTKKAHSVCSRKSQVHRTVLGDYYYLDVCWEKKKRKKSGEQIPGMSWGRPPAMDAGHSDQEQHFAKFTIHKLRRLTWQQNYKW